MSQEIRNQIEGIRQSNIPQHFTFEDTVENAFDNTFRHNSSNSNHRQTNTFDELNFVGIGSNNVPFPKESPKRIHTFKDDPSFGRRIKKLEDSLLEKKTELKAQQENAVKELKNMEQKYKEKIQVDQLHFENSQRILEKAHSEEIKKLKKEMVQIKSDARLVIDFIRRKANEAIAEETSKVKYQKMSLGKKMEALESEMKKTFHHHLMSLEEEVRNVVKKERNKAVDLKILPPPPPKNISILRKDRLHPFTSVRLDDSLPSSDESKVPVNKCSDDSISTCNSDEMFASDFVNKMKDSEFTNEHEILRNRVQELEHWTDTLTLALRSGAKIISSPCSSR